MSHAMLLGGSEILRVCDSADFDGATDYSNRGAQLTGISDGKTGLFSCWMRLDGGDSSILTIIQNANASESASYPTIRRSSANAIDIQARNSAGTLILRALSDVTYTASATWLHVLLEWNMARTPICVLYVNDINVAVTHTTSTDDTINYTRTNCRVGANGVNAEKFNGCLAELYWAPNVSLDLSLVANRRKFISSSGKPIHLGSDGSLPTGTAPIVYFHLDDGEAVANFATNRGTGGNFSITGTLDTGSSSPSD